MLKCRFCSLKCRFFRKEEQKDEKTEKYDKTEKKNIEIPRKGSPSCAFNKTKVWSIPMLRSRISARTPRAPQTFKVAQFDRVTQRWPFGVSPKVQQDRIYPHPLRDRNSDHGQMFPFPEPRPWLLVNSESGVV